MNFILNRLKLLFFATKLDISNWLSKFLSKQMLKENSKSCYKIGKKRNLRHDYLSIKKSILWRTHYKIDFLFRLMEQFKTNFRDIRLYRLMS